MKELPLLDSLLNLFRKSIRQNPNNLEAFATDDSCEVCKLTIISSLNHPLFLVVLFPLRNVISGVVNSHRFKDVPTMRAIYSFTKEKTFSCFGHQFSFGQIGLVRVTESISQVGERFHGSLGKGLLPLQAAVVGAVVEARGGTLVWQTQIQISLTSRS